jgi:UDPglucose 6-dehydrogenase
MEVARPMLPNVDLCKDPYDVAKDADAVIIVTEWNEFKQLDLEKVKDSMKSAVVYDGRNIYDPAVMREMGFNYRAIGRGNHK